jgi:Fic family protein
MKASLNSEKPSPRLGRYQLIQSPGENFRAYIPPPLPPNPTVRMDGMLQLLERATQSLGRLDGITSVLPNTSLFIYMYVRKEALLSSQIEGTQSSFSDLLLYETTKPTVPYGMPEDVAEVSCYVSAMNHGLKRVRGGFPVSLRLFREIHRELLSRGRGQHQMAGEFRTSQNWVGGTRPGNAMFVPPPADCLMEHLGNLEKFLHSPDPMLPALVRAALVHVQFESIHPFLDGNGRLGRLLITFLLCAGRILIEPTLYLSLYFKTNRNKYYDLLQRVRTHGDWETWVEFFLTGVEETSTQAVRAARDILQLLERDRSRLEQIGRPAASALRLHRLLERHPLIAISVAADKLGLSVPTVATAMEHLQKMSIVEETTGRQRDRLFGYARYLRILEEGTEPISAGPASRHKRADGRTRSQQGDSQKSVVKR